MRDSVIKIVRRRTNSGIKIFRFYLTFIAFVVSVLFIWGLTNVKRDLSINEKLIERFEYNNLNDYLSSKDAICGLDISDYRIELSGIFESNGEYYYKYKDGKTAKLTLDRNIQEILKKRLSAYNLPFAAAVIMDAQSGKITGLYEVRDPSSSYSILKAYRTASVFKVITMETLLSTGRINPSDEMCYHGGKRRLNRNLLIENPKKDYRCMEINKALGYSANVIFARLAYRYLDRELLNEHTSLFGFGEELPVEFDTETSSINTPLQREELAYTAAGFGETYISPVHGAVIASIVANRGIYIKPTIIEEITDNEENILYSHTTSEIRRVMSGDVADKLSEMMSYTVKEGTAHKFFAKRRPVDFISEVPVAGKTGSLAEKEGNYTEYNWFVGFAPKKNPRYVISVLTINSESISARAVVYARRILDDLFGGNKSGKSVAKIKTKKQYLSKR